MRRDRLTIIAAIVLALGMLASRPAASADLMLAVEDDWYPYAAEVNGRPEGISVDLVRAAYAAVGVDVGFRIMTYVRCMELVDQDEVIGCFNTPGDKDIRERQLLPEEPLDRNPAWIYTRATNDTRVTSLSDLKGEPIGIVNGYRYAEEFMSEPGLIREAAGSDLQNLKKLVAGRLQYVVLYERVADWLMGRYGEELGLELRPVLKVGELALYVSFSKHHPAAPQALNKLDEGLRAIKQSGEYQEIMHRWEQKLSRHP